MNKIAFFSAAILLALSILAAPSEAQTRKISAFGDSITFGYGDVGVDCGLPETSRGYPSRLRSRLGQRGVSVEMSTYGVCGETTSSGISRIDKVLIGNPDLVLLMEGTNDISAGVGAETIVFNLLEMARKTREAGAEPLLASVIPRGPETSPDSSNTRTAYLTLLLEEAAANEDIVFADPFNIMFEVPDLFEVYYADPYHPNASGYSVLASIFVDPTLEALDRERPAPCVASETTLCLNEDRFRIEVSWRDFEGLEGVGIAEQLTNDTGTFWFFNQENIELTIKALDGRCINGHFWIFYGALSNVEYTITVFESATGKTRTYENPSGTFASVGDTQAFAATPEDCSGQISFADREAISELTTSPRRTPPLPSPLLAAAAPKLLAGDEPQASGPCISGDRVLCLNEERFALEVAWLTPQGTSGNGHAMGLTDDTGYFWFFQDTNVELVVKVLDGRPINGHFWVFYGSLTNVQFDLAITDLLTGQVKRYRNPINNFASVGDIEAFPAAVTLP